MLNGDVTLTTLAPLANLESIEGDLVLEAMYNLPTVDGLSALRTIGGDLSINHSNIGAVDLDGLGSVGCVGGNYEVSDCHGDRLLDLIGTGNVHGAIIAAGRTDC